MSAVQADLKDPAIGVGVAEGPASLRAILQPGCAAALWHRQTPPEVRSWLGALDPAVLPNGRVILPVDAVATAVTQLCDMSGLPAGAERRWLQDDIVTLAEIFADLMQARYLRLRLQVLQTNACRKFHIDAITARLICTYKGTGTQYGLSCRGGDPDRVFTAPTGAPIVLRGTLWPEQPAAGFLHRSPPIEGSGESRLVLVLDPMFDPEDDI